MKPKVCNILLFLPFGQDLSTVNKDRMNQLKPYPSTFNDGSSDTTLFLFIRNFSMLEWAKNEFILLVAHFRVYAHDFGAAAGFQ
jgi:hypothetical protein